MAADTNILTADLKERFPFPREVRFQGGALGELGEGHEVNRQGALFGSFF